MCVSNSYLGFIVYYVRAQHHGYVLGGHSVTSFLKGERREGRERGEGERGGREGGRV